MIRTKKTSQKGLKLMRRTDWLILVLLAIALMIGGYVLYGSFTAPEENVASSDDVLDLKQDPIQGDATGEGLPVIEMGGRQIFLWAKARYSITGQLVSKNRYVNGFMSDLSPWDYALAWGQTDTYIDQLRFQQMVRFCLFEPKKGAVVDFNYVNSHISNNHLIPATKNIRRALALAKKGDIVKLDGYLVNVEAGKNGQTVAGWNTSTTRTDTGNGACEIIYVTRLRIGDRVFE
jgi:hypothetical protein